MAGMFTVAAPIRQAGVVLSQPVVRHDAVERVAVQDFDQAEVGQVAVQCGGRALAGFLHRVHRKFQRHAAGVADAVADPAGEFDVVAVAGGEVGAGLRDADDRLAAAEFLGGDAVVHVALEVERGHRGVGGFVKPPARAQAFMSLPLKLAMMRSSRRPLGRIPLRRRLGGWGIGVKRRAS